MRIAYLCNSPIPSNIASGIQVVKMCQALTQVGNDITLFCPTLKQASPWSADIHGFYGVERSFRIKRLPRPNSWADRILPASRLFRWQTSLRRFDLIMAPCNAWKPYLLHKVRRPMILEAHLLRRGQKIDKLVLNPWLRGLVVTSEGLRRDYTETYALDAAEMLLAHNGADSVRSRSTRELPGSNPVRCGYVGNLYRGKGMETIIPLARRCPRVDFHVFGGTEDQIGAWRQTIGATQIPNLWFHGALPPSDTDAARLACDLLIAPYGEVVQGVGDKGNLVDWMSPLKVFEYMAAGKAIVTSDLPTLREVLQDRENALLVPPNDLDAWARAIDALASDTGLRQRLGARAHQDFVRLHSYQARARRIMEAFGTRETSAKSQVPTARPIKVHRAAR